MAQRLPGGPHLLSIFTPTVGEIAINRKWYVGIHIEFSVLRSTRLVGQNFTVSQGQRVQLPLAPPEFHPQSRQLADYNVWP